MRTFHLSIEPLKKGVKVVGDQLEHLKINNLLFGGNKGYEWMASFLGLMSTITLKRKEAAGHSEGDP